MGLATVVAMSFLVVFAVVIYIYIYIYIYPSATSLVHLKVYVLLLGGFNIINPSALATPSLPVTNPSTKPCYHLLRNLLRRGKRREKTERTTRRTSAKS